MGRNRKKERKGRKGRMEARVALRETADELIEEVFYVRFKCARLRRERGGEIDKSAAPITGAEGEDVMTQELVDLLRDELAMARAELSDLCERGGGPEPVGDRCGQKRAREEERGGGSEGSERKRSKGSGDVERDLVAIAQAICIDADRNGGGACLSSEDKDATIYKERDDEEEEEEESAEGHGGEQVGCIEESEQGGGLDGTADDSEYKAQVRESGLFTEVSDCFGKQIEAFAADS